MELNETGDAPSEGKLEPSGSLRENGGVKRSNKVVVAIWVTLLLSGVGLFVYLQNKNRVEAERLLNEAYTLYAQGDVPGSTEYLRQSAELGNAWAQVYYGERLRNGFGAERNIDEALKWLRKAAKKKCPEAFCQLGSCYENGEGVDRDLDEAEKWYGKALNDANSGGVARSALERIGRLKSSSDD